MGAVYGIIYYLFIFNTIYFHDNVTSDTLLMSMMIMTKQQDWKYRKQHTLHYLQSELAAVSHFHLLWTERRICSN